MAEKRSGDERTEWKRKCSMRGMEDDLIQWRGLNGIGVEVRECQTTKAMQYCVV